MLLEKKNAAYEVLGEEFKHLLVKAVELELVSGVGIGVLRGQESFFATAGSGVAEDSSYEIGSITKTFTCELLHGLIDEGKLSWDESLESFLPKRLRPSGGFRSDGVPITLGDLATHHSGLPLLPSNFRAIDAYNPYGSYTEKDLIHYLQQRSLLKAEDQPYEYSNVGYAAIGFALEQASGRAYADLLREEILLPLGLKTQLALIGRDQPVTAQGHTQGGRPIPGWKQSAFAPAGALCSTVPDMLRWCRFLLSKKRPRTTKGNIVLGDGWARDWYIHDGLTGGFTSFIGINDQANLAVVLLANRRTPGALHAIAANAMRALQGEALLPLSGNYGKFKAVLSDTVRRNPISINLVGALKYSRGGELTLKVLRRLLEKN